MTEGQAGALCPFCETPAPKDPKVCASCGAERLLTPSERMLDYRMGGVGFTLWFVILLVVFGVRETIWPEDPSPLASIAIALGALAPVVWVMLRFEARVRRRLERASPWRKGSEIREPPQE